MPNKKNLSLLQRCQLQKRPKLNLSECKCTGGQPVVVTGDPSSKKEGDTCLTSSVRNAEVFEGEKALISISEIEVREVEVVF